MPASTKKGARSLRSGQQNSVSRKRDRKMKQLAQLKAKASEAGLSVAVYLAQEARAKSIRARTGATQKALSDVMSQRPSW